MTTRRRPRFRTTAGQLADYLRDLPPDTPVLTSAFDHSYREVDAGIATVVYFPDHDSWSEDFDPDADCGPFEKVQAVIID